MLFRSKTSASEVNLVDGKVLSINAPLNVANPIDVVQVGQIAAAPGIEPVPVEVPVIGLKMVVVDRQGAVLANADVVLKKKGSKQEIRGKTDANGKVFFPAFSSGDYVVKVSAFGNQVYKKHLQLRNGETTSIQTRADTVEVNVGVLVTAEAPLIDTGPAVISHFPLNPE